MYESFFGLSRNPFSMTADPAMLYVTPQHREALAALSYGIAACRGMMALTGEAGTGKTTLLMRITAHLQNGSIRSSIIFNPNVSAGELLETIAADFGVDDVSAGKARILRRLQEVLLNNLRQARICLLIVDEAHRLSGELIEELRLLGNFETPRQKLLQVVLAGQPELASMLNEPSMRQVKQRIAVRARLEALTAHEVPAYVDFRWSRAGQTKVPFSMETLAAIADVSRGIPRAINSLCDNALVTAFAERSRVVTRAHVFQAATDLDLSQEGVDETACSTANPDEAGTEPIVPAFCSVRNPESQPSPTSFLTRFRHRKGSLLADARK